MKNNNGIKGYIKWEKEEEAVDGIEDAELGVREEGLAAELIGIP